MTWVWDEIQEFLSELEKVRDPALFETGIEMVKAIFASIHDIDHNFDQRIAKALDRKSSMKRVRTLLSKLKGNPFRE